jgi:hypothetical protein
MWSWWRNEIITSELPCSVVGVPSILAVAATALPARPKAKPASTVAHHAARDHFPSIRLMFPPRNSRLLQIESTS